MFQKTTADEKKGEIKWIMQKQVWENGEEGGQNVQTQYNSLGQGLHPIVAICPILLLHSNCISYVTLCVYVFVLL